MNFLVNNSLKLGHFLVHCWKYILNRNPDRPVIKKQNDIQKNLRFVFVVVGVSAES